MSKDEKVNVAVIGAGLIGTTLSYYLSKNDKFNITVYERNRRRFF